MDPGYVEGPPQEKTDEPIDNTESLVSPEVSVNLSTHSLPKTIEQENNNESSQEKSITKTKEVESCSKQLKNVSELESKEEVAKVTEQIVSGHNSFIQKNKSNMQILKSPSQDINLNEIELKSETCSVAYSNSEFSIPSALKVGLGQYSFLDKYSYSYLDAYITPTETRLQTENRKLHVQLCINSDNELIQKSNINRDVKSGASLLPVLKDKDNLGIEKEILNSQNVDVLKNGDATEIEEKTVGLEETMSLETKEMNQVAKQDEIFEQEGNKASQEIGMNLIEIDEPSVKGKNKNSVTIKEKSVSQESNIVDIAEKSANQLEIKSVEIAVKSVQQEDLTPVVIKGIQPVEIEETMLVKNQVERIANQNDGQRSTIMIVYSQASVEMQTAVTDYQSSDSEQIQAVEDSDMLAVTRQNRRSSPSDFLRSGQLLNSPVVDIIQPILCDTGQPELGVRTSPLKFNHLRQKEQSRTQMNREFIDETSQIEHDDSTQNPTLGHNNASNSCIRLEEMDSDDTESPKEPSESQSRTSDQIPGKSGTGTSAPNSKIPGQQTTGGNNEECRETSDQVTSNQTRKTSILRPDSTAKTADEQQGHPKMAHSRSLESKISSSSNRTSTNQMHRESHGVHIKDEQELPGVKEAAGVFKIVPKESTIVPERRLSTANKATSGQDNVSQESDTDTKVPSYSPSYATPVQQRSGLGTGAAVGLGVGALAAGGLAGYALGGGFGSDSPTEEVHVAEDFGGDSEWMD